MAYAIVSRRMQFTAGPQTHTFYACEEHREALDRGDVSCFLRIRGVEVIAEDPEDELACDFCREGGDPDGEDMFRDRQAEQRDEAYERAAARARGNDFADTGGKDWT